MKESTATKTAFFIALCVPALALGLLTPTVNGKPDLLTVIKLFPAGYFYAILFTLPFAVPAYFFARRFKLIYWWSAVIMGSLIGMLVSVIIRMPCNPVLDCIKNNTKGILILASLGALAGEVFWIVWIQHKKYKND